METKTIERAGIIQLHLSGKRQCEIFKLLQKSKVSRQTISYTIKRYIETGSIQDRKRSGRPRSVRTPRMVKALKERIRRNPRRSQKKLAIQMKVSRGTLKNALKEDLGVRAMRRGTFHMMTQQQQKNRVTRCRALLRWHAGESHRRILFTDEKIFTVEENFKRQNDRIYAKRKSDIPLTRRKSRRAHHPASVMVWLGVSWVGKAELYFVPQGVKVRAKKLHGGSSQTYCGTPEFYLIQK